MMGSPADDADSDPAKAESSESESQVGHLFPLECKPYQCLCCLDDATLSLHDRL
jgi:hypothetical protein